MHTKRHIDCPACEANLNWLTATEDYDLPVGEKILFWVKQLSERLRPDHICITPVTRIYYERAFEEKDVVNVAINGVREGACRYLFEKTVSVRHPFLQ